MGWQQRRSRPQPTISVGARVCNDDYIHFGKALKSTPQGGSITAVADTGCQSCLIGLNVVHRLGFKKSDLLSVQHKMSAVNKNPIDIIGAVILRLHGPDKDGYPLETTQICYVTPVINTMFLSREACVDLGFISSTFPAFGEALGDHTTQADTAASTSCPGENVADSDAHCT